MNNHFLPEKSGYLNDEFRIFSLVSEKSQEFQTHYHSFHKLLFFESGAVSYYVEGETYELSPFDLVFVPAGEVHRPIIHSNAPYRRLILYLSPAFFEKYEKKAVDLFHCFSLCSARTSHVLRFPDLPKSRLYPLLQELMHCAHRPLDPAELLYQKSVLLQFLLLLNQAMSNGCPAFPSASVSSPQILQVISYINQHLTDELSIDQIASACFLHRSYLMHLFRQETGTTIGSYIAEKRLFTARTLIRSGVSITDAALQSGFPSYCAFYRAYQKKYGHSPKDDRLSSRISSPYPSSSFGVSRQNGLP